jgi:PAS domain S-box-containing protein
VGPHPDRIYCCTAKSAKAAEAQASRAVIPRASGIRPDAMIVMNRQGKIVLVKSKSCLGINGTNLLGQVEILVPERFRRRHPQHRNEFFAQPRVRPMGEGLELFGRRKDGTEFSVEVSLSPLETEEGTLVSAAVRDVTERIRARRCVAPSDGRSHAHQQGDHHGGADCLSGARNQAADCSDGNERSNLLALASARSTQRSKNIRNCVKGRERRNARDIISRVQLQFQKGPSKRESVDVNEVIREMIALLESEATRYNILVLTELAQIFPRSWVIACNSSRS